MRKFTDIIKYAPPKKVVIAPPGGRAEIVLDDLVKHGFSVNVIDGGKEAAKKACRLLFEGKADIMLQGGIELEHLFFILEEEGIKREDLCYVSIFEDFKREKLMLIADTYIHDFPDMAKKVNILTQTIKLAKVMGIVKPKVAILSFIETINPNIPSTVESAALSKMSQRGQLDALVEGPLDIDCALSSEAAVRKGLTSPVPGETDIFICPNVESGYALSQYLTFLGGLSTAGILLGTPRPVVINPCFIPVTNKLVEVAIAAILMEG